VVLIEGHLPGVRDWAWPVTLIGALAVVVAVVAVVRPLTHSRPPRVLPVLILGAALLVETMVFGIGQDSYNNVRGWSVLLFPLVLGVLGAGALAAREPRSRDLGAAAVVTFAVVQMFWAVSAYQAMDLGYYDEPELVRAYTLGLLVTAVLVLGAVRVSRR
jgi:hypothetical protein